MHAFAQNLFVLAPYHTSDLVREQRHRWLLLILVLITTLAYLVGLPLLARHYTSPFTAPYRDADPTLIAAYLAVGGVAVGVACLLVTLFFAGFAVDRELAAKYLRRLATHRYTVYFCLALALIGSLAFCFSMILLCVTQTPYFSYELEPSLALRAAMRQPNMNQTQLAQDFAQDRSDDAWQYPDHRTMSLDLLGRLSQAQLNNGRRPLFGLVHVPNAIVLTSFLGSSSYFSGRSTKRVQAAPLVAREWLTANETEAGNLTPKTASNLWNRSRPVTAWVVPSYGLLSRSADWEDPSSVFAFLSTENADTHVKGLFAFSHAGSRLSLISLTVVAHTCVDAIKAASKEYALVTSPDLVAIVEWDDEDAFVHSKFQRGMWFWGSWIVSVCFTTVVLCFGAHTMWRNRKQGYDPNETLGFAPRQNHYIPTYGTV